MSSESKIDEFVTITGASRAIAMSLLSACNDSLEMAINMHMEGVDLNNDESSSGSASFTGGASGGASTSSSGPSVSRKRKAVEDVEDEDDVREPIPQKRETLIQAGYEGYSVRSSANVNRGRVRSVFDGFRNFGNEARSYSGGDGHSSASRGKKRTLEELFKPPLDLMFKGGWQSVRDAASAAKKWLIVNIQDAGEFQCQLLNRDVWSNDAVRTILGEHFLFWQQYKEFEEAQRYMTFYPVTEWPHVAILDPRTGERLVTWSKLPDSATFCDLITEFLTLHPVFDAQNGASSKKTLNSDDEDVSIVDASEDDQLAAAIQASLADSNKSTATSSRSPPHHTIYDSDSDLETFTTEDEDSNMSARSPVKKSTTTSLPSLGNGASAATKSADSKPLTSLSSNDKNGKVEKEPSKTPSSVTTSTESSQSGDFSMCTEYLGDESGEKSSIIIRFPDGKKEKKDIPCSSKFMAIIKYVVSQGFPLETYEIVTNFPRRVLSDLDESQTLKDLGLFPRETIFVQQRM